MIVDSLGEGTQDLFGLKVWTMNTHLRCVEIQLLFGGIAGERIELPTT